MNKEWRTVLLISLAVIILANIPTILGYLTAAEGEVFMGVPARVMDTNNHLNWILQAKEGALLFTNDFTAEEVPALIFNPFHLIIGNAAKVLGTPITGTYNAFGILILIGFCLALYLFISSIIKDKKTRMIAYLITLTSAGFGLWWKISKLVFGKWIVSSDLWVTEMNTFQSFGQPHFTISATLLILIFHYTIKSLQEDNTKYALIAGTFSLLLATIHIFDTITLAVVLLGWFVYIQIVKNKWSWKNARKIIIIGGMTAPAVAYYAWVFFLNPAYREWNTLNQTTTPQLFALISGFGLVFILALIYVIGKRKEYWGKTTKTSFLVLWSALNLILIYLPINVQRRFLLGLHIPLSILSAIAIVKIISPYIKNKINISENITTIVIVLLCATTTIFLLVTQVANLHQTTDSIYGNDPYLTTQEYQTLKWIDENTNNSDIIVAPYHLSNYIPAVTGNKVYCGHWAQTINFTQKCAEVNDFYAGNLTFNNSYYYVDMDTYEVRK